MNSRRFSKLVSIFQVLSALFMFWLLGYTLFRSMDNDLINHIEVIIFYLPLLLLLLLSIFPIFILSLKHRVTVAEGSLIPIYLFFISMSSVAYIPSIEEYIGITMLPYVFNQKLFFFFLLCTEIVLLFAAIINYDNTNTSRHHNIYTMLGIATALIIAIKLPLNSNRHMPNSHSMGIWLVAFSIMLLGLMTYFANFLKDKESYALKRFFTFVFLSLGHMIIVAGFFPVTLLGAIFYFIGIAMLCLVSPHGY